MNGSDIIDDLKSDIPKTQYQRYFRHIKFNTQTSTPSIYNYEVPNIFVLKWIQSKYKSILEKKAGDNIQINISITKPTTNSVSTPSIATPPIARKTSVMINPSYTFESFAVGQSNEFAFISVLNVAKKPGTLYNPLFLYGGVGLGKTHLLQAIANANLNTNYKILYISAEDLLNDFRKRIKNDTMNNFRDQYRSCDILLVDDVQFFSGKEKLQEEFFHTFNELHNNKKQIVLTSDQKPSKIKGLQERLQSRFEWGLTTHISPPDLNTKIDIIKKKCEIDDINLTDDIILYMATHLETNIRELEGILIKINAFARYVKLDLITLDFAKNILKEHIDEKKENITIDDIINTVARELNVKPSEIKSKIRTKAITYARRVSIYLIRDIMKNSMPYLAKYFKMKDHSAISHNIKTMKIAIKNEKNEYIMMENIKNKILNIKS